jgi:hypothetical protein
MAAADESHSHTETDLQALCPYGHILKNLDGKQVLQKTSNPVNDLKEIFEGNCYLSQQEPIHMVAEK